MPRHERCTGHVGGQQGYLVVPDIVDFTKFVQVATFTEEFSPDRRPRYVELN